MRCFFWFPSDKAVSGSDRRQHEVSSDRLKYRWTGAGEIREYVSVCLP